MSEDYLYENEKYEKTVELLRKINSSLAYTAPEAMEHKYYLLAEKYSDFFTFEMNEESNKLIKKAWREIDHLLAHWISHTCDECGSEPRHPTKVFPNIMKLGQELKNHDST